MRRGSVAVEYALVFPFFLVILLAVADFGWVFYQHGVVTRAVRYGCRQGATNPTGGDPVVTATAAMDTYLVDNRYACPDGDTCASSASLLETHVLSCTAELPVKNLSTLVPGLDDFHLRAATRVRVEWTP